MAAVQAALLDDEPMRELDARVWVIADIKQGRFGEVLSEQHIQDLVSLRDKRVIDLDGEEVFVQQMESSRVNEWRGDLKRGLQDVRLLGVHLDHSNRRNLDLRSALALMHEAEMKDWKLRGPRAVKEFLTVVAEGVGDLNTYHLQWLQHSGVNEHSAVSHIHGVLCEVLRQAVAIDQVNPMNLLSLELVVRRLVQDEIAVAPRIWRAGHTLRCSDLEFRNRSAQWFQLMGYGAAQRGGASHEAIEVVGRRAEAFGL
eukprot:71006-Amphidinium_carterae.1